MLKPFSILPPRECVLYMVIGCERVVEQLAGMHVLYWNVSLANSERRRVVRMKVLSR